MNNTKFIVRHKDCNYYGFWGEICNKCGKMVNMLNVVGTFESNKNGETIYNENGNPGEPTYYQEECEGRKL